LEGSIVLHHKLYELMDTTKVQVQPITSGHDPGEKKEQTNGENKEAQAVFQQTG
jgi:hypothetical protein